MICDGDAKTIATLNEKKPYGDLVTIIKDECVGHIQKRMGNRLEKVMVDFRRDKRVARAKMKVLKDQLKELKVVEKEKMKAQIEREKSAGLRKGRNGKGIMQLMKENSGEGSRTGMSNSGPRAKSGPRCNYIWPTR